MTLRPIPTASTLTVTASELDSLLTGVFCRYNGFPMSALGKHDGCTFVPVRGAESQVGGFARQPLVTVLDN